MLQNKRLFPCLSTFTMGVIVLLLALAIPTTAFADDPVPTPDNGNCITCHENLYFLHDTGNWYCLRESPMTCVGCHGGDPTATTKELAHYNRAAHPVVNEDISKCQQCHPEECLERLEIFNSVAGISNVLVAIPYTPSYSTENIPATPQQEKGPGAWVNALEFMPILLVASIALTIYLANRIRHAQKGKS
jgi:hypothetical protein